MKVKGTPYFSSVQLLLVLLSVSCVVGQAPYPASGYRPSGKQFDLPRRPPVNRPPVEYGAPPRPPSNQYGSSVNKPQPTITPPDQYLPSLDPSDFRGFDAQQDNQQVERGYTNQRPQQNQNNDQNQVNIRQQNQPDRPGQGWNQNFPANNGAQSFDNQQTDVSRQNAGGSSVNRKYLSPSQNSNGQNQNFGQKQSDRQLYQTDEQDYQENFANNDENDEENADQIPSRKGVGVANENYLPPTSTEGFLRKPTQRRRYPEPTTSRPEIQEPENQDPEDPNVAIATAVARGQYYLVQPDGRLQRITYKTTQTQEDIKNNEFSAKLVYQNVEPIAAPIYTYNAPLVRIN